MVRLHSASLVWPADFGELETITHSPAMPPPHWITGESEATDAQSKHAIVSACACAGMTLRCSFPHAGLCLTTFVQTTTGGGAVPQVWPPRNVFLHHAAAFGG